MKKPRNSIEWAEEAVNAYDIALEMLQSGALIVNDRTYLFRAAPLIAIEKRKIENESQKKDILANTITDIEFDFEVDPEAQRNYMFYFVLAYIRSHVHGGYLEEKESDRVMEYINSHYDLFEHTA